MRTNKLMRVLSFITVTATNINLNRNVVHEVDKKVKKKQMT